MLPYFVILPLWLLLAVGLPLVQSLHALQKGSADRKVWLFYWVSFVAASWLLYFFEWLIRIPFYVLGLYVDIYYEAQLLAVAYLVFPSVLGVRKLEAVAQKHAAALDGQRVEKIKVFASELRQRLLGMRQ